HTHGHTRRTPSRNQSHLTAGNLTTIVISGFSTCVEVYTQYRSFGKRIACFLEINLSSHLRLFIFHGSLKVHLLRCPLGISSYFFINNTEERCRCTLSREKIKAIDFPAHFKVNLALVSEIRQKNYRY